MDQINPATAQRVWQRVRGTESKEDALARLLALENQIRHTYQYLLRTTHLHDSRLLHRLREESRQFSSILSGLCLIRQADITLTAPPSVRGNAEGLLCQCWRTRLQELGLLDALPPEDAPWSTHLKERMEEHAMLLLELLGQLPRK